MRCKGNESMCDLVLASEAYRAVESRRRLSSFARLFNVRVFKLRSGSLSKTIYEPRDYNLVKRDLKCE